MKSIIFWILCFVLAFPIYSQQNVRKPFDNISYAWSKTQIEELIKTIEKMNQPYNKVKGKIIAAIFPHDDHLYSGITLNSIVKQLGRRKLAVIFGVTHKTPRKIGGPVKNTLIFDNYSFWQAPYQNIKISDLREFLKTHLSEKDYIISNTFHSFEHSIEAVLPFLNYYSKGIEIVPIMVPPMDLKTMDSLSGKLSKEIANYLKNNNIHLEDVIFLISTDANHYGEDFKNLEFGQGEEGHTKARKHDLEIFEKFYKGEITKNRVKSIVKKGIYQKTLWCGRYSIPFGLLTTEKVVEKMESKNLFGHLVRYDDTYIDPIIPLKGLGFGVSAPFSLRHWVGHIAIAFTIN